MDSETTNRHVARARTPSNPRERGLDSPPSGGTISACVADRRVTFQPQSRPLGLSGSPFQGTQIDGRRRHVHLVQHDADRAKHTFPRVMRVFEVTDRDGDFRLAALRQPLEQSHQRCPRPQLFAPHSERNHSRSICGVQLKHKFSGFSGPKRYLGAAVVDHPQDGPRVAAPGEFRHGLRPGIAPKRKPVGVVPIQLDGTAHPPGHVLDHVAHEVVRRGDALLARRCPGGVWTVFSENAR